MTPSGISTSVSAGLETPDMIELRKRKNQIESDMESLAGAETPALYKILPEKSSSVGASMMGSSKVYDLTAAKKAALDPLSSGMISSSSGIDLALNPDELDMSSDVLQSRYDQQLKQNNVSQDQDDESLERQNKKKKKKRASQADHQAPPQDHLALLIRIKTRNIKKNSSSKTKHFYFICYISIKN